MDNLLAEIIWFRKIWLHFCRMPKSQFIIQNESTYTSLTNFNLLEPTHSRRRRVNYIAVFLVEAAEIFVWVWQCVDGTVFLKISKVAHFK